MAQLNADQMRQAVRRGQALPAPDQARPGRYNIRNRSELADAISAVGRAGGPSGTDADRALVRRFVMKRARALGFPGDIPSTWSADGSLKS